MSEPHPVLALVFSCTVLLCMFGFARYIDWDAKRKSRARLAEMEREREASRVYWAPRIAAALEREAARQTTVAPVAPRPTALHNPVRRRFLPLNEPKT